jgi:ankyrin repeat protein
MATGRFDVSSSSILKAGLESLATESDKVSIPELQPGCATLHVAAMSNSPDAIDLLLKYGVDANVKDATGRSPLHYAVQADSSILIEKLLKAGARPDAVDVFQKTPLMAAAEFGAIHAASTLLKHGANLAAVNLAGENAMHNSYQGINIKMLMFLLDSGCDPYQLDNRNHSPVYYALPCRDLATYIYARCLDLSHMVNEDHVPMIGPGIQALRLFLSYSSKASRSLFLTMRNEDGDTVLIESAIGSGPDFIQVCVKAGAQLELTRKNGDTALLAACRVGQLPSVAYLVRQGAKLEYKHRG